MVMRRIFRYTALVIIVLFAFSACNSTMSNEEVLKAYIERHNNHDIEGVVELFHPRAVVELPGRPPLNEIRKIEAWDAAVQSRKMYESWEVQGDTIIIGTIIERNNWYSHGGIRQVEYQPGSMFIFREGKIFKIRSSDMTVESQQLIQDMFRNFLAWAQENKPGELARLMPNGAINLEEGNSKEWFLLMDEWQRSR
jgi:hypothetical protein